MPNEPIATNAAPAAIGPYSQAVRAGPWLYCSGQIPLDPTTGELVGDGDVAAEARQVLSNLDAILTAAGASRADVVKATIFLCDIGHFAAVNQVYADYFAGLVPPARACIQAAALPRGVQVEIEFIAHLT